MTCGVLTVQTDWDFSVVFKGVLYDDYSFELVIEDLSELDDIKLLGQFASPYSNKTKDSEFREGILKIKADPTVEFDDTSGNRGVEWRTSKRKNPIEHAEKMIDELLAEPYQGDFESNASRVKQITEDLLLDLGLKEYVDKMHKVRTTYYV